MFNEFIMASVSNSIFDIEKEGFSLWNKEVENYAPEISDIVYQGYLNNVSRRKSKIKERFLILTRDGLFHMNKSNKVETKAVMLAEGVRVFYHKRKMKGQKIYSITFVRSEKYCEFFIDNKIEFKKWTQHLNRVFIQVDFHSKYTPLKIIGSGSFASVYLIERKATKERFAVKAFLKENVKEQDMGVEGLLNEIDILKQCDHQNIMRLEEMYESESSVYLVMELIDGEDLLSFLEKDKKFEVNDLAKVMSDVLQALVYLSKKQIIHKDIKLENIIIHKNKYGETEAKLIDFGLSTYSNVSKYLYPKSGTVGYMAPEVINWSERRNTRLTPACDVFSSGILFFTLVAGCLPFKASTFSELMSANSECELYLSHDEITKTPYLKSLLTDMLDINPNRRITAEKALQHNFFALHEVKPTAQRKSFDKNYKNFYRTSKLRKAKENGIIMRKPITRVDSKNKTLREEEEGKMDSFRRIMRKNENKYIDGWDYQGNFK